MDEERKEEPKPEEVPRRINLPGWMLTEEEIGLGEAIERVIYRVGIKLSCQGCKQRAAALNRRVVLSRR